MSTLLFVQNAQQLLRTIGISALALILLPTSSSAQSLGTFRWQLQPFCNVVSLNITQSGSVFRLEGTDDQCGFGGRAASAIGTAFLNGDGSVALGLTVVGSPGAAPTHVMARIGVATLGGTWQDSGGNTGAFVLTAGAATAGSPRTVAAGAIGATAVNASQVQLRVSGSCSAGQLMQAVNQDGTVICAGANSGGDITAVSPSAGLQGGGASGDVSIGLRRTANAFDLSNDTGLLSVASSFSREPLAVSGPGRRFVWHGGKGALRAGEVNGTAWDDENIGFFSVALGFDTRASAPNSVAIGDSAVANGPASAAVGFKATTVGFASVALGANAIAAGDGSFVFGDSSTANQITSFGNQFRVRAANGSAFFSNSTLTAGVLLPAGGGAWSSVSDVNMKEHFRDLDDADVLSKIARMPVREWSYKAQDPLIRHMGPTAQDFHAAFGLGEDPLTISTIDADGVALRAIQALEARTRAEHEQLLEDTQSLADANNDLVRENSQHSAEIAALKAELAALRAELLASAMRGKP